jgi:hypothetical protein
MHRIIRVTCILFSDVEEFAQQRSVDESANRAGSKYGFALSSAAGLEGTFVLAPK